MTIKIQAFQRCGVKTDKCIDTFEFCCWTKLHTWLHGYSKLHSCPECQSSITQAKPEMKQEEKENANNKK